MQEKHEKTILLLGAIGGIAVLVTSVITIVRSNLVADFIAKARGK
ncbi:MAG: hypothetical protein ACREBJ_13120 [Nitrosotalea sp.]